jgi:hypothetical protein
MNTLPNKRKTDWWIYTIPALIILSLVFHIIIYTGPEKLRLGIYYLGQTIVSFLAVVFLIVAIIQSLLKQPFLSLARVFGFSGLLLFPISFILLESSYGTIFNAYPSSYKNYKSKVQFRLPLDTAIAVAWGGDKVSTNYHVTEPDQRWAYDLFVIHDGKTYDGDSTKLESYYCYGLPILSPAAGEVVRIYDSMQNVEIGQLGADPPHGNHIVIKVAPNEYLFICHIKPKSFVVKTGDRVQQGQLLAQVGNSGNTSEPHIHIHLQDTDDLEFGEGIPLYFSNYKADRKYVSLGMPKGGFDKDGTFVGQIVQHQQRN